MRRLVVGLLLGWPLLGSQAGAQYGYGRGGLAAGLTPQGDYLRGVGVEAAGLGAFYQGVGSYNLNTAQAESIQADTAIRVDTYLSGVLRAGRDNFQLIEKLHQEKAKRNYEAIRKRIREHPEELDVMSGNSLNAVLEEINDPRIHPSSYRLARVVIPAEVVRKIPFKLDEKGVIFSMSRMTPRGKGRWPVAFQDDRYNAERQAFERVVDKVLELMIEKRMTAEAIDDYRSALEALSSKLDREYGTSRDRRYNEAKSRIAELSRTTEILKTARMQAVLAEIDQYGGTTVDDLRRLMQAHNLRFAFADSEEERRIYPDLYAALVQMRNEVRDQAKEANP